MAFFLRDGNTYRVADNANVDIHNVLPVGNYIVKQDMFGNFLLEQIDSFTQSSKIYGTTMRNADRILRTFADRAASTGVMLNGEKGSGKTLLAKMISIEAAKQNIPTIVINNPWCGDGFNALMQDIDQPCIVLFDEFEKVYDSEQQEQILTLLDGVFPSKKLFVITCNDKYRVDQHMRNRPGRIFYMLDFKGLEQDFILEYCNDTLNNKSHADSVCKIASLFSQFNFDMLKALIEEMNRYDETAQEAMKMLNAKPEFSDSVKYDVQIVVDNQQIETSNISPAKWRGNPLVGNIEISWYAEKDGEDERDWEEISISQNDLQKIEPQNGRFVFSNEHGTVILTREREKLFDYYGAF
jgi:hypothetical protein